MRLPICAPLALLAAALTLEPGPAAFAAPGADGVDRLAPAPLAIPLEPSDPLPASGTPDGYFFNLWPYGAPTGAALADHGIYLVARDLSEEMGAIDGGIKRGGFFEGYSSVGADLDLHRIAGIPRTPCTCCCRTCRGSQSRPIPAAPMPTTVCSPTPRACA